MLQDAKGKKLDMEQWIFVHKNEKSLRNWEIWKWIHMASLWLTFRSTCHQSSSTVTCCETFLGWLMLAPPSWAS